MAINLKGMGNKSTNKKTSNPLLSDKPKDALGIKIVKVPTSACAPWELHDRGEDWYDEVNSKDLLDSIKQDGDQHIPGLVREIPEDKYPAGHRLHGKRYEIIYGARRHYACKENGVPVFLAQLCDFDDKRCLALMHIENAQRKDISKMERAKSIAMAYRKYWVGAPSEGGKDTSYSQMAETYQEAKSTIHEYETAGRIWFIDEFDGVFADFNNITKTSAMKMVGLWEKNREIVCDILNRIKEEDISDPAKAKYILNEVGQKEGVKTKLYSSNSTKFKDDDMGMIEAKVNEKGVVTIKMQATAANVNKKLYSKVVEQVMTELGIRKKANAD